jgi:hypothetical protein
VTSWKVKQDPELLSLPGKSIISLGVGFNQKADLKVFTT